MISLCLWMMLSACATVSWYSQAARGQIDLLSRREHIADLLEDPSTDPQLARRLARVLEIRAFAHQFLVLPDSRSYRHYADLERSAAVWNVIATPPYAVQPRVWCYPLVGCLAYRGYFRRSAAEAHAEQLRGDDLDVIVSPAVAYSTLGWFSDPVLNTMLRWDEAELAGFLFHELTHEKRFVAGDTAFNEAYATVVETLGVERWLQLNGQTAELQSWRARQLQRAAWSDCLLDARARLQAGYEKFAGDEARLEQFKVAEFDRLSMELIALAEQYQAEWLRRWADRALNNADLALVASYRQGIAAFRVLLEACEQEPACFHRRVQELADGSEAERARFLQSGPVR